MNPKEFLNQGYRIEERIEVKFEQIRRLKALAEKATATYTDQPHGSTRRIDSRERILVKIINLENKVNQEIDRYIDTNQMIQKRISEISDIDCRTVLELRYLSRKKWSDIAVEMGYCLTHIYTLHNKGLNEIQMLKEWSKSD